MKKVVLIDGNNLMFRSYYATAYSGSLMKNSEGFPTNALYGFVSMINKIINEENPSYMAVAFDIGKNFRHEKYSEYKAGRNATPEELKVQMPIARNILDAMGIKHFEVENYEADDIIGTLAKNAEDDPDFEALIVSSDRDLLQLISNQVSVKLLKQTGFIRYDESLFIKDYGIKPINIIDMKALSGDSSDNIPGVKGIGEKTALTLLQKYETLENIYDHIDEIKGKTKEKLEQDHDMAFFSKDIATIYREVPLTIDLEHCFYEGKTTTSLNELYKKLDFHSLIKKDIHNVPDDLKYTRIENINELNLTNGFSYYLECNNENYHVGKIIGMGLYDGSNSYFIPDYLVKDVLYKFGTLDKYTFDLKKNIVLLKNMTINNSSYDLMIAIYLLGIMKDDLASLTDNIPLYKDLLKNDFDNLEIEVALKAKYIYETREDYLRKIELDNETKLFNEIEMPLVNVLADMEYTGVKVDKNILEEMKNITLSKVDDLDKKIHELIGIDFNVASPKQLGEVLFEKLNLPYGKKGKDSYSTDASVLEKLIPYHPAITLILEYRNLKKLCSTYLEGLQNYILEDGKVHTIYKQNLTRTGRLSSVEPNLQNIPVRDEEGRMIRKAFFPGNDEFLCADYSQIELRLLAHIANSKELIEAFINGEDIHKKVASDIYGVKINEVTSEQRKNAKAVIFGIVYGISGFGLSEGTNLSPKEAKEFINKYYELYPDVKNYMDNIKKEAYEQGYVTTLFNRKRIIEELSSKIFMIRSSGERIALNTPIQGTCADIIKMAMIKVYQTFKERNLKSKMVMQVHDELIFDLVEEEKEVVSNIVKETMENIIKINVPLKVSMDYGSNWYDAK